MEYIKISDLTELGLGVAGDEYIEIAKSGASYKKKFNAPIYMEITSDQDLSGYTFDDGTVFIFYNTDTSSHDVIFDGSTTKTIAAGEAATGTLVGSWKVNDIENLEILLSNILGTSAYIDAGTSIGEMVQLEDVDGSAGLPAVDGSQITGLSSSQFPDIQARLDSELVDSIVSNSPFYFFNVLNKNGDILGWVGTSRDENVASGTGFIQQVPPTKIIFPTDETGNVQDAFFSTGLSYVLMDNGNLYLMGNGDSGFWGDGTTVDHLIPFLANTGVDYVATIRAGAASHTERFIYIVKDDTLWFAGDNGTGQGADGTTTNITTWYKPQYNSADITGIMSVWMIQGPGGWVVVELNDGTILVAGGNGNGNLGDGTTANKTTFTDVTSAWNTGGSTYHIEDVIGQQHFVTDAASNRKWMGILFRDSVTSATLLRMSGYNSEGQLGDTTTTQRTSPVTPSFTDNDDIAEVTNVGGTVWVRTAAGLVWRWGRDDAGQQGQGSTSSTRSTPYNSGNSSDIDNNCQKMFMEYWHSFYYTYLNVGFLQHTDGTVWASGSNTHNEIPLGNYALASQTTFVETLLPTNLIQIGQSANYSGMHFIGLLDDGTLIQWGGANYLYNNATNIVYRTWIKKDLGGSC